MIKPILIPTDKCRYPNCIWLGRISGKLRLDQSYDNKVMDPIDSSMLPQDIILIDTEAKIVESNFIFEVLTKQIFRYLGRKQDKEGCFKIISTSDKEFEALPQLSEQSIKLLINYYKEHKVMPESVEVEYEIFKTAYTGNNKTLQRYNKILDNKLITSGKIKLNQQNEVDITIPEEKMYSYEEMCSNMQQYLVEYIFTNNIYITPQDWLKKHLK